MASVEARGRGFRVKWRFDGRQQSKAADSQREAAALARWVERYPMAGDDARLWEAWPGSDRRAVVSDTSVLAALDAYVAGQRNAGTRDRYAASRRRLAALHDVPVAALTRAMVDDAMAPLADRYAESSWTVDATALKAALRPYGKADTVAGWAKRSKARTREPIPLTRDQIGDLVLLGEEFGVGRLVHVLGDLGLRIGEAFALRREHAVHLGTPHPSIRIREQFPATRSRHVALTPEPLKTDHARRDLPLSASLAAWVADAGPGLLVPDMRDGGGPWCYTTANRQLRRLSAAAVDKGIVSAPVHFHDFRHSWGMNALLGGADLVTVSRLMGHSSVTVTGDIYGHVTPTGLDTVRRLLS